MGFCGGFNTQNYKKRVDNSETKEDRHVSKEVTCRYGNLWILAPG